MALSSERKARVHFNPGVVPQPVNAPKSKARVGLGVDGQPPANIFAHPAAGVRECG